VVHYRPIVCAGSGEFEALARAGDLAWATMTPVLELAAGQKDARATVMHFLDRVREYLPVRVIAVDAGAVPPDTSLLHGGGVLAELLTELGNARMAVLPVVRAAVTEDWADAAAYWRPYGMMLRVRAPELGSDPELLVPALLAGLAHNRVGPGEVDLMLDFANLDGLAGPGLARQAARLREAAGWRSVTVASGAFPVDLRGVAQGQVTAFRRWDVDLWRALNAGFASNGNPNHTELDYADYGVAHPRTSQNPGRRAPPQLRYTVQDRWLVLRGAQKRSRSREFPDVCRRIRALPEFMPDLGAADQAIVAYASGWHGPGNATTWRSLSTAHHLDFVTHRLATWGEP
jgi:Beta protein